METVGVRELKSQLSHHLRRVRAGVRLVVTDRGRSIATLSPIGSALDLAWADQLVACGQAHWDGGKPLGCLVDPSTDSGSSRARSRDHRLRPGRPRLTMRGRTVSDAVLEDRR
jgi:antitoxin (DNA-binding transcriptional repressor) of toxin-antitoxin stability system